MLDRPSADDAFSITFDDVEEDHLDNWTDQRALDHFIALWRKKLHRPSSSKEVSAIDRIQAFLTGWFVRHLQRACLNCAMRRFVCESVQIVMEPDATTDPETLSRFVDEKHRFWRCEMQREHKQRYAFDPASLGSMVRVYDWDRRRGRRQGSSRIGYVCQCSGAFAQVCFDVSLVQAGMPRPHDCGHSS